MKKKIIPREFYTIKKYIFLLFRACACKDINVSQDLFIFSINQGKTCITRRTITPQAT